MLYCEGCRVKNEWGKGKQRLDGMCDLCHTTPSKYEAPSCFLPPTKKDLEELDDES